MPNARLLLVVIALVAVATSGCINVSNVISLKPTGSGTMEMTVLVNTAVFKQVGGMFGGGDVKAEGKSNAPSAEDIAKQVSKMKGVRLVSQTPIKQGDIEGSKVLLAFDDVNQISVSEDFPGGGKKPDPKDELKFSFTKQPAGTSLLSISFPERPASAGKKDKAEGDASSNAMKPSPEMLKMMSGFLKGMRMMIAIDVDGTLVRTSSPYVEGNRVTLIDVDMEQLFSNPEAIDKMAALNLGPDTGISQARDALAKAGVKGIKINDPKVTIELR
jgi:hypothetical protein